MAENLLRALAQLRGRLLDPDSLVRAVASGRQKAGTPRWRRVELRYVDLKAGRHLQLTAYDETQAHTSNHVVGDSARDAVDDLLDEPFGNWHVETTTETVQLRVTRKGEALVHTSAAERAGRGRPRPRPRQGAAAARGRPAVPRPGAGGRRRPAQAEPARQVPPGRGVPPAARHRRDRGDRQGSAAQADARGAAPGRGPRLRQRLPDLRGRALPRRRPRPAGPPGRRRRQGAVPRAQREGRRRARPGRRRSWSAPSAA